MQDLLINIRSRPQLENYVSNPTHALLLVGPNGVGLGTIAGQLAHDLAGANQLIVTPNDKGKISVEQVRNLYDVTRGKQNVRFVIVIDDADTMTIPAQNAFLKLLEEPIANVHFILTAHLANQLLPTIHSRVQQIEIMPIAAGDLLNDAKLAPNKQAQMLFLAGDRPAELKRMLESDEYFRSRAKSSEIAKEFIAADTYSRLRIIAGMKNRDEAISFTNALANLLIFMLMRSEAVNLIRNLDVTAQVIDNLTQNGNVRAQMTYLATNVI